MAARQTIPISLPPGIVKRKGSLEATGRYVDGDHIRFVSGQPSKIGGWKKYTTALFKGIARALHSWNDLTSRTVTAIGTTSKLYAVDPGLAVVDITPVQSSANLTNAFTTAALSKSVTVTHAAHGKVSGQGVTFSATSGTVGGLAMDGSWTIDSVVNANTYTFQHSSAAASSAGPTASTTVSYDIPPGPADPAGGFGYGVGTYGSGTYGTARTTTSIFFEPYYWSLSHFGKLLMASPFGGTLYQWDPTTIPTPRATAVPNAPGAMRGHFVTPERFIITYGCSPDTTLNSDPMLLRWCSQANYLDWLASTSNTANARRLTEGKKIMGGGSLGSGVSLIWTDTALYVHQYTGSRFVFDTRLVGTAAGLAGPNAFCFAQGRAFWFSGSAFHTYSGSIAAVPNSDDVKEWVLDQLRAHFETKTLCFFNQRFNEVWWLFVPESSTEPTLYVAFNLTEGSWIHGTLTRTAAATQDGGDNRPLLAGTDGWLYLHENGVDADTLPLEARIKSGPFQLSEGGTFLSVTGYVPDFGVQDGDVNLTIEARDRTNSPPHERAVKSVGPQDGLIDLRIRGRIMSFEIQQRLLGGTFSLGKPAFEAAAGGLKR